MTSTPTNTTTTAPAVTPATTSSTSTTPVPTTTATAATPASNATLTAFSYPQYTSPSPVGNPPPTSSTYPYGAYPTAYAQTPGAYTYQAAGYQAGVTGYGWTYPYSYIPHTQNYQTSTTTTAQIPTTAAPVTTQTSTVTTTPAVAPRTTTFTSYTPTYLRDNATTGSSMGRGSRKSSNFKGLFSKELKSLMYGFGDDRNPANDTVNVMEEILVEYIADVCQSAGSSSKKTRLSIEDLRRALSRPADAKKLARMEELLFMQEDIKRARSQFEPETNPERM